uniref:ribosomal protein L23 n=1 Tax=Euglena agilis TaxID=96764 RepID=UPI0023AB3862|nr:ribosomal protein L23 [Euglena agilis]WCH63330.1 ribosomal protein L23 [Euglena agilis]
MIALVKSQVLTDKTNKLLQKNVYVFDVSKKLSKKQAKVLIQKAFNVTVLSINSYVKPGKFRRLNKLSGLKSCYKRVFIKIDNNKVLPYFSSL